jgi:hypothetical protein
VLFLSSIAALLRGLRRRRWPWFALAGVLAGLAPQFRPNLVLIPPVFFAYVAIRRPFGRWIARAAVLLAAAALALTPWTVRNYRLTGTILPTSVHGGVQLWYGTLQTGPYLRSRAHNPRSIFEGPTFEYTSLLDVPIVFSARINPCTAESPSATTLEYWTDRDQVHRRIVSTLPEGRLETNLPPPREPLVLYYFLTARCGSDPLEISTPRHGAEAPFVYFVSRSHLEDLDRHDDLLDVFDIVRLVRHAAWREPPRAMEKLESAGVASLEAAVDALTATPASGVRPARPPELVALADRARLVLADDSVIEVPRGWSGRITDLGFAGPLAFALMHQSASLAELRLARAEPARRPEPRAARSDVSINRVFYRREPHMMGRYMALAMDNIRRAPGAFVAAAAYRAVRLFVVQGTTDPNTAHQFSRSRAIYAVATLLSLAFLALFAAGAVIAVRKEPRTVLALVLILYVPVTIAPVLTNMRYTVTVQPLMFMFAAAALSEWRQRGRSTRAAEARPGAAT